MSLWSKKTKQPGSPGWQNRKHERLGTSTVRCSLGTIADISATGLRVMCEGKPPVEIGQVCPFKLKFDDGALTLQAQVRWCKRRGIKRHEIGLKFVALKPGMPDVLEAIARFGMASMARQNAGQSEGAQPKKKLPAPPTIDAVLPEYFRIMDLTAEATPTQIRKRYRELAVAWHPDRCDHPDALTRFEEINEAYHVLCDPQRRKNYLRAAG